MHGGGFCAVRNDTLVQRHRADYNLWQNHLHHDWLARIQYDAQDNVWIGSDEGISMYSISDSTFKSFKSNVGNSNLASGSINDMFVTSGGEFWVATNSGVCVYDYSSSDFNCENAINTIDAGSAFSIEEDKKGNLWIGTTAGLVKYFPLIDSARLFTPKDGVRNIRFGKSCSQKAKNGKLYFGGDNGYLSFYPDSIKNNTHSPSVFISDFRISHQSVEISNNPGAILTQGIAYTKSITLNHEHKILTFEFIGLNYIQTEKNQFKYFLEGFDNSWHNVGSKYIAIFRNPWLCLGYKC